MIRDCRMRWRTVLVMVCALLFSQMAIVAHACGLAEQAMDVAAMAEASMPCAETMAGTADDAAAICHSHCQASQGAPDHSAPQVADMTGMPAVLTLRTAPAEPAVPRASQRSFTRGAAGPPIAIAHCCFRI